METKTKTNKIIEWIIIILAVIVFICWPIKFVVFDSIIGKTIYDENDIIVKFHRIVNRVEIYNNSDEEIYVNYIEGFNTTSGLEETGQIKSFEREYYLDDAWLVKAGEEIKEKMSHADGYIFVIYNKNKDMYESVKYIK